MLQLATCEPYFNELHGGASVNTYMVIYSYNTDEFYNNDWVDELKYYMKQVNRKIINTEHDVIQNYPAVLKNCNKMNLVEIVTDNYGRDLCIIHTHKINIIKRLWKKKQLNKMVICV
jgi:hypothetical protein